MSIDIHVPVLLSISTKGLTNKDTLSKSDPFVIIYDGEVEIGRTETIQNNLNPVFSRKIQHKYYFEKIQTLKFSVRDDDGKKSEDLGVVSVTLAEIISKSSIDRPLKLNGKDKGVITIKGTEIKEIRPGAIQLNIVGSKLDKKDTFGKSDPYLVIYNKLTNEKLFTTEIIKNTLDPVWRPLKLTLCESIRIECFDWDKNSAHDLIGTCEVPLATLKEPFDVDLISKKQKKAGTLKFSNLKFFKEYSFLDFIQNGTELNFAVAIDFTGSNGHPHTKESLHFIGTPNAPNQQFTAYEHAISSIGGVLEYYDSDRLFPVLGFGAKINNQVFHNFNVNLQQNPNVQGTSGILGAYRNCLHQVELYGPTNFAPVINSMLQSVTFEKSSALKYYVLLIITDGEITDMDLTIQAIIDASTAPLSIVIVGVGPADFTKMKILDGDDAALSYNGKTATRDIVQFVAMRDYNINNIQQALPAALLQEIPGQLTTYMNSNGFGPVRPID